MNVSFQDRFRSLTDFEPMNWQCRLFRRFLENDLPTVCDLPTGLGKTSIIVIWLLALLRQAGEGRIARVDILADARGDMSSQINKAMRKTLALARLVRRFDKSNEGIDVSPGNVRKLLAAARPNWIEEAFSPRPYAPPLTDVLLDSWSLTSIENMPGRPEVAAFLHGVTRDPPEAFVAWREELSLFGRFGVDEPLVLSSGPSSTMTVPVGNAAVV